MKKYIYSCQNKDCKGIDVKISTSENDLANLRLYETFYIRKCKPTLNSREECSEFVELLFQYFILQTILQRFQRSFVQRQSIIRALCSIHSLFLYFSYVSHIFYTFHLHFLCIYIARPEYLLIPDDPVDRPKLGFQILLFNSSFKPHQKSFIF